MRSSTRATKFLWGSLVLAITCITAPAFASEQGSQCMQDDRFAAVHEQRLSKVLALTEEQQQTLKNQRESQAQARQLLREQTRQAEDALISAVNSGASETELQRLATELGKLKAVAALEHAKSRKAFLAVLTPEQQQKLEQMKIDHRDKRDAWHGRHKRHPGAQDS